MPDPVIANIIARAREVVLLWEDGEPAGAAIIDLDYALARYDEEKPFVAPQRRIKNTHKLGGE